MNIQQIIPQTKIASPSPILELLENDQVFPAGMWRWRIQGDTAVLERATATDWSTVTTVLSASNAGVLTSLGTALADDQVLSFGGVVSMLWETQDANANELHIDLPTGGAVDVPVIVIGQGVTGVDLGQYNGVTEPRIALWGIGAVATAPIWEFRKARGTIAAPTAITSGDDLGSINAYACVAAGEWVLSAAIELDSEGVIATTRGPSLIKFRTSTDTAPSVLTTWMEINSAGHFIFRSDAIIPGFMLKAIAGPAVAVRNEADGAYLPLFAGVIVSSTGFDLSAASTYIQIGSTSSFQGYTGVAWRDILIVNAGGTTAACLNIGRDDTDLTLNAINDMLVLQAGGGTGNEAAGFGLGISIKLGNAASEVEERASWDTVLVTATNGSEDSRYDWSLMAAGAMNLAMSLTGVGVLSVDLGGSGSAAQVDLFDDYDDALVLRQSIQQNNRQLLVDMGIAYGKPDGGHMVRVQPMMRLLAGGIYQGRALIDRLEERVRVLEGARA